MIWLILLISPSKVLLFAQPDPGIFIPIEDRKYDLSQKQVKDILQDRDGFIWIATNKGLFRYDGHGLRAFLENPLDKGSIGDNFIYTLAEDRDGSLWIASGNGLFHYDRQKEVFTAYRHDPADPASLAENRINDILVDRHGELWVATFKQGLDHLDRTTDTFVHYRHDKKDAASLSNNAVTCLEEDAGGRIWVGTAGGGLNRLDPETGKIIRITADPEGEDGFTDNHVLHIEEDSDGYLWFSNYETKLFRIDTASLQVKSFALFTDGKTNYRPTAIFPDGKGALWLGTPDEGLLHFTPQSGALTRYHYDSGSLGGIPSNQVSSLWLDQTGLLWVGFLGSGLSQLLTHPSGFEALPVEFQGKDGLSSLSIQCISEARDGKVWIGTWENGLFRYDPETRETAVYQNEPDHRQSLADDMVWDIVEDSHGGVWLGTHNGLQKYDPVSGTFATYGVEDGLEHRAVRTILQDHIGKIWIGTFGGLHWLDAHSGKIQLIDSFPGNPSFIVTDLLEDLQNNLWVATHGRGVFRLDCRTNQWTYFQKEQYDPNTLSSNIVRTIAEDAQGRIWLGTEGGGLNLLIPHPTHPDSSTFRHWRPYNSVLPDDNVINISIDKHDKLWLSTDAGLFSFDPETEDINPYTLPGRVKGLNAKIRAAANGPLYAGNNLHAYRYHPDSIWQNDIAPPVFITDLQIGGKSIPVRGTFGDTLRAPSPLTQSILFTSSLELKHWQNDLTFVFTALNYIHPEKNRYRYQLENNDEGWTQVDPSQREIRYTNLSPGYYRFRVQAFNNEGVLNEEGKTIEFRIRPPWWRTWWAYCGYGVIILAIFWVIRRYELNRHLARAEARRLRDLDQMKAKLYTNITHEFRTPLTVISGMADQVLADPEDWFRKGLEMIKRNSGILLNLVNQMLDLSKLESGTLKVNMIRDDIILFLKYLTESFHSYAETKDIRLHLLSDLEELSMDFDPEKIQTIFSNLVGNAIKFTPEGGDVYITVQGPRLTADGSLLQNKGIDIINGSPSLITNHSSLMMKVRDSGTGIPAAQLPFIFDRFYQGGSPGPSTGGQKSSSHRGGGQKGVGIGLALTRELVKLLGGSIEVESKEGIGAEFKVLLPIKRETEKGTAAALFEGFPLAAGERVSELTTAGLPATSEDLPVALLIEDNKDVLEYLSSFLQGRYRLEKAMDGQEGIEKAIELVPDIIISDVMMPKKDGFEVVATLKQDERTSHIPVILLTARADRQSRLEGLEHGADAYLAKPFDQKELEVRLRKLIDLRRDLQSCFATLDLKRPSGNKKHQRESRFLLKVRELIEKNLENEDFGIHQLCAGVGISRPQLHRKLKALTGRSTSLVIRSIRVQKAKELLETTDLNVSEVGYAVGFSNRSHFTQVFKEEVGQPPSSFRGM